MNTYYWHCKRGDGEFEAENDESALKHFESLEIREPIGLWLETDEKMQNIWMAEGEDPSEWFEE